MSRALRFLKQKVRLILAITLATLVGGAAAGVAMAAIPDGNGVIHGCYRTNGGQMRIIDSATQTCNNSETAINWNQTGPQGPPGTSGSGKTLKVVINGQEFGPVVDPQASSSGIGEATFWYEPLQRMVTVERTPVQSVDGAVMGRDIGYAYFSSGDCTGTPYVVLSIVDVQSKDFFYNNVMSIGYSNHYIIAYNEPPTSITPQSMFVFDASTATVSCAPMSADTTAVLPLTPVNMPINTPITEPLRFVYN